MIPAANPGRGLVAAASCLALTACGISSAVPPRDIGQNPTIVSLNPCSDAILAEVADRDQILAISHYSKDPRSSSMEEGKARSFPATRGTVEEVVALQPDVVIGNSFADPVTQQAYARLGLRLERFGVAHDLDENYAQIRRLAGIAGHKARGEALIARIEAELAHAAPPADAPGLSAVLWQSGGIVPGRDTLILELMQRTGFASLSVERGYGQADRVSLEVMLSDPPHVLVTAAGGRDTGDGGNRALRHPVLDRLTGTARYSLDPRLLYCGGPTIIAASRRLAQIRAAVNGKGGA